MSEALDSTIGRNAKRPIDRQLDSVIGTCNCCGEEYAQKVYRMQDDPWEDGYVTKDCPRCHYDPRMEEAIREILSPIEGISQTTTISDLIIAEVIKYW
ncbi:hypothetical protein H6503_06830 [Candidatus Woesearchaeota archaeon]|nr:hypothetical protein [Candidatus Woesearchaeota archaeon]